MSDAMTVAVIGASCSAVFMFALVVVWNVIHDVPLTLVGLSPVFFNAVFASALTWAGALLISYIFTRIVSVSETVTVGVIGGLLVILWALRLWRGLDEAVFYADLDEM